MLRTEAIKTYLLKLTHSDLAELYNHNMEVQVNVAQDDGTRIKGDYKGKHWTGWTDDQETWKSFRIPYNAATKPEYEDKNINFNLAAHVEAIGMTGWDWYNKQSLWVAFDFDNIISHKVGLTTEELDIIQKKAAEIPYITVRKSTGGSGIHFYIFFHNPPTIINHNEHQSLARAVLGQLAAETGYDFANSVDVCGGNMWVWHRKMTAENKGLKLTKLGEPLRKIPINWRDHLKVVIGRKRKSLPKDIPEDSEKLFQELTGQYVREPLDEAHKKLIEYLKQTNAVWSWNQDSYLLVTHTIHLQEAYKALGLRGIFHTDSSHTSDQNCYCFPLKRGAWVVRRFTRGVQEHVSWDQDSDGWTRTYFNMEPDINSTSKTFSGVEHPSGGYQFRLGDDAQSAAKELGAELDLPNHMTTRGTKLKLHKDGRLIAEVDRESHDNPKEMVGWIAEGSKFKRIFKINKVPYAEADNKTCEDLVRHLTIDDKADAGWAIQSDGAWVEEPLTHVKLALKSSGLTPKEVDIVLGGNIFKRWKIVNKPFQAEYPGSREWNRDACQFKFFPSKDDILHFPTWKKVLTQVGARLDETLIKFPWAQENGITTGYEYLKCWVASCFQFPHQHLPYLFFFGPEQSGKSMFHEALSLLITPGGYQRADVALTSPQGFNGELKSAIICVVEETDLSSKTAITYPRIKDWVTSIFIPIHPKNGTPFMQLNSCHFIHCAQHYAHCPVFSGDTRVTVIQVDKVSGENWEAKDEIIKRLRAEAPHFLGEVMRLELPKSPDRLNVPVLYTEEKAFIQKQSRTALEEYLEEHCFHSPGYWIKLSDFFNNFQKWLDVSEGSNWSIRKIGKFLPKPFVKGRSPKDAQFYIGNISFKKETEERKPYVVINNILNT